MVKCKKEDTNVLALSLGSLADKSTLMTGKKWNPNDHTDPVKIRLYFISSKSFNEHDNFIYLRSNN